MMGGLPFKCSWAVEQGPQSKALDGPNMISESSKPWLGYAVASVPDLADLLLLHVMF